MIGFTMSLFCVTAWTASPGVACRPPQKAVLTGHLVNPVECRDEAATAAPRAQPTAPLPDVSDKDRASLDALQGVWRGSAAMAGSLFEFELAVSGHRLTWTRLDLRFHGRRRLQAELKMGLFSRKQPFKARASSPDAPGQSLEARVWLGAAPLEPEIGRPSRDRLAVWVFDGRPEEHRVEYSVSADEIDALYMVVDPAGKPQGVPLKLRREAAKR